MPDFTISQLDTAFRIRNITEKNQSFSSSINPQFFFENSTQTLGPEFPYIYAGGTIIYSYTTSYNMTALPYYILIYVTEGECRFRINGYSQPFYPNSMLFLCPGTEVQFDTLRTPFSYKFYVLGGTVLDIYYKHLVSDLEKENDFFYISDIHGNYIHSNLLQIDYSLKNMSTDSNFYVAKFVQDILTECLHSNFSTYTGHSDIPSHVLRIQFIFEQSYMENHSLDSLEAEIGISKYKLCRDFSKYMNISPLQYLNQKRISVAKDLLKHSDMTIHAVGASVGIPNTNHFIHLFQKNAGVTPLQFRNAYRHALF